MNYHLYPIQIDFEKINSSKKAFFEYMKKKKILLQSHYLPIYRHSFYRKKFNLKEFPASENFYKRQVSIPIFYTLKKKEMLKVTSLIKEFVK